MRGWLAIMGLLAVMCGLVGALREQGSGVRTLGMQEMNVEGAIIGFVQDIRYISTTNYVGCGTQISAFDEKTRGVPTFDTATPRVPMLCGSGYGMRLIRSKVPASVQSQLIVRSHLTGVIRFARSSKYNEP